MYSTNPQGHLLKPTLKSPNEQLTRRHWRQPWSWGCIASWSLFWNECDPYSYKCPSTRVIGIYTTTKWTITMTETLLVIIELSKPRMQMRVFNGISFQIFIFFLLVWISRSCSELFKGYHAVFLDSEEDKSPLSHFLENILLSTKIWGQVLASD